MIVYGSTFVFRTFVYVSNNHSLDARRGQLIMPSDVFFNYFPMILEFEIRRLTKEKKNILRKYIISTSYLLLSKIASCLTVASVKIKTLGGGIYNINLNTPRKSPPGVRSPLIMRRRSTPRSGTFPSLFFFFVESGISMQTQSSRPIHNFFFWTKQGLERKAPAVMALQAFRLPPTSNTNKPHG